MKHLAKLVIHNFQSHAHTELEFDSGTNVIVGDNNKGKSAIIRAMKWLFYNEPKGDGFVRFGTDDCFVKATMSDGYEITRRRQKAKNMYIVRKPDGEAFVFDGFGSTIPAEVSEATGVAKLKVDQDIELALNLDGQLEGAFLTASPGSVKAKAIGSIVNTHLLDAAERDLQRDITRVEAEQKGIDAQIALTDEALAKFSDLAEQEAIIAEVERDVNALGKVNALLEKLDYLAERRKTVLAETAKNRAILASLGDLTELDGLILRLQQVSEQLTRLCTLKTRLDSVRAESQKTEATLAKLTSLPEAKTLLVRLEELVLMGKTLVQKRHGLENVNRNIGLEQQRLERLRVLPELDTKLKKLEWLVDLVRQLVPLKQRLDDKSREIAAETSRLPQLRARFDHAKSEYAAFFAEHDVCPTCNQPISSEQIERIVSSIKGEDNDDH